LAGAARTEFVELGDQAGGDQSEEPGMGFREADEVGLVLGALGGAAVRAPA